MDIAFVSAYLDIYHDDNVEISRNRGVEWRLKTFQPLADTGIPIYLFYSQKYAPFFENEEYRTRNPTVILFKVMELEDTWTWKISEQHQPLSMPEQRDEKKDTYQYMILQNSKQDFIQQVMECFPHHSHYAWIDFSIVHMFKHPQKSLEYLRVCYGPRKTPRNHFDQDTSKFFIPGCWGQRWYEPDLDAVMKRIHWRFCGSFFIASANSMQNFIRLYRHCFPLFLKEHRRMIWEVNFWAWLEVTNQTLLEKYPIAPPEEEIQPWRPIWYSADHNDTIYRTPYWAFASQSLTAYPETRVELLKLADNLAPEKRPQDDQEWIGSSSFVYSQIHGPLLNTRVMNYWLYPNGYYRFIDPKHILRTRNLLSKLDEHGQPLQTFAIEEDFDHTILKHHKPDAFSQGLEDIRLWHKPSANTTDTTETLRFIATNINYTPNGRGRMMTGSLDIKIDEDTQELLPVYRNLIGIEPDRDTATEKNWTPVILPEISDTEDHFIYQWSPFQIGKIQHPSPPVANTTQEDAPRAQLKIHTTVESQNPFLFERIRGSSPFIQFPSNPPFPKLATEEWLGVVHFSDEDHPRKYSHVIISLDKQGKPVRYSAPFSFCNIGVEFCVGFHAFEQEQETLLRFWISRHDRDTSVLTTPLRHIPLEYSYPSTHLPEIPEPPQESEAPQKTPINIFILCYNEELVIPHTIRHYRTHFPSANITIYDNESTDRSREIAAESGCRVVSWGSGNIQNEYIQQNIKNDVWKPASPFVEVKIDPRPEWSGPGWKIIVDMDEWLEITEADLAYEEAEGNTILRIKGVNVMGQSQHPLLVDVSPDAFHQWNLVADWDAENKNLCFLTPQITNMNYTRGAHGCKPEGERVQYSKRIYYNKHMENLGLPFFIRKFTLRAKRNEIMQTRNINLHYTDDIDKLTERYQSLFENAYVLETFAPITDENYPLFVGHYYT